MILTKKLIHAALNNGSPNRHQCKMLGITYPLPGGWLANLVGREESEEWYEKLCSLRKQKGPQTPTLTAENVPQQPTKTKGEELFPCRESYVSGPYLLSRLAPNEVLARFMAGESIEHLSEQLHSPRIDVEAAIRTAIRPTGSAAILALMSEAFPSTPMTPEERKLANAALEAEFESMTGPPTPPPEMIHANDSSETRIGSGTKLCGGCGYFESVCVCSSNQGSPETFANELFEQSGRDLA